MADDSKTLADNLKAARERAGNPSYDVLSREMYDEVRRAPNAETIRRHHVGAISFGRVDLDLIAWLSVRYGVSIAELSPSVAHSVEALKGVLTRTRWSSTDDPNQLGLFVTAA